MNEKDLIRYLKGRLEKPQNLVSDFLGEDCEVIDIGDPDRYLLLSVDTSSESVDFPTNSPPQGAGYYSTAVALSDIAACGGEPLGILVSCTVPPAYSDKMAAVYEGVEAAALDAGTRILGGDTNSAGEFSLSVVCLGRIEKNKVLLRHRANLGDLVGVTGEIDKFNYGYYQYSLNKDSVSFTRMLMQPAPIMSGRLLADSGGVTSCIDLPDGLVKALGDNMPEGLGFLIYDESLPVSYYRRNSNNPDVPNYILASEPAGDTELLFTARPEARRSINNAFSNKGLQVHWIGRVVDSGRISIDLGNTIVKPEVEGFIHQFAGRRLFS